jgi:hypothetical protein
MKMLRSARWLLLALLLSVIPASSYAGVLISVGFAPPALPVYEQPPCPEPGLMWTPGYWAYGEDGYYWVPGAWVPAPYEGALWTPGYWGWSGGNYVFHEGYWGPHVGYYGGVNYGFGYGGFGFFGGMWRGHEFVYNTAAMHVDRRYIHSTYEDRGAVERGFVARDSHVAFSGGPGGIRYEARPEERMAEHEQHMARTNFQAQHEQTFRADRGSYVKNNGGRPQHLVVDRPLGVETHSAPTGRGATGNPAQMNNRPQPTATHTMPAASGPGRAPAANNNAARPNGPAPQVQRQSTPQVQPHAAPQGPSRPAAQPQSHSAPGAHPAPAAKGEHEHK